MELPNVITCELALRDPQGVREQLLSEEGGVLLIDKPYGETSFFVVNQMRKRMSRSTGIKWVKVGHAGTLDPLATGLLLIATRRQTKRMPALMGLDKTYALQLRLGITSPSFDLETPITATSELEGITHEKIVSMLTKFEGAQSQVPPMHSAIKQQGKPVYLQARKGITTELQPRSIFVHELTLCEVQLPHVRLRVHCSKGTYVRSLVHDIGIELGTGAVLTELVRESVGPWSLRDALSLEQAVALVAPEQ